MLHSCQDFEAWNVSRWRNGELFVMAYVWYKTGLELLTSNNDRKTSLLLLLCSSMNHISTHLYLGIIESPSRIPRQTDGPTSWKNSTHQKWTNTTWSCKHELFNFYTLIFLLIERFLKCFRVICILFYLFIILFECFAPCNPDMLLQLLLIGSYSQHISPRLCLLVLIMLYTSIRVNSYRFCWTMLFKLCLSCFNFTAQMIYKCHN